MSSGEFAKEMGKSRQRGAGAEVLDPFAVDGGMDQCFAPERVRKSRRVGEQLSEVRVRNEGDGGFSHAAQVVVDAGKLQRVQVGHVARHVEGRDLVAFGDHPLAGEEAAHHDGTACGRLALAAEGHNLRQCAR